MQSCNYTPTVFKTEQHLLSQIIITDYFKFFRGIIEILLKSNAETSFEFCDNGIFHTSNRF